VIRHIRSKLSCCCERIVQAPAPDLPIEKGRPGPGLVANLVVSKFLDGLPFGRAAARPGDRQEYSNFWPSSLLYACQARIAFSTISP
jgi:transposase